MKLALNLQLTAEAMDGGETALGVRQPKANNQKK
jgi:hypothetical protein